MESKSEPQLLNYLSLAELAIESEDIATHELLPLRLVYVNSPEHNNSIEYVAPSESTTKDPFHSPTKLDNVTVIKEDDYDYEDIERREAFEASKARQRHPDKWRSHIRKSNKNKGLEYIKVNGEVSAKKEMGPPCSCLTKCFLRIGQPACEKIFNNFWKLGDYSLQNAYIAGCVRICLPKYTSKKLESESPRRRFYTRKFYVNVNGIDTEVCKQAFLSLHSISNGRLDRLLKKKQEVGNTGTDSRGRHANKVNKIPMEKIREVRRSIDGFRKRAGFLGKRKSKNVELLPGTLNIRIMYRKYREEVLQRCLEPVCEFRYRKIFHTDYHLDFLRPSQSHATPAAPVATCPPPSPQIQVQPVRVAPSPVRVAPSPSITITTSPNGEKSVYTTLETKDLSNTYVALPQYIDAAYTVQTQGWILPAHSMKDSDPERICPISGYRD